MLSTYRFAVLLAQDDGVLATGCGCGAWNEGGHHSEVGVEARFLGTECRVVCLIGVLHGTGGAAGNDPQVKGAEGMVLVYEAGGEVEGYGGLLADVCGRAGIRDEVLCDGRHVGALLSAGFEVGRRGVDVASGDKYLGAGGIDGGLAAQTAPLAQEAGSTASRGIMLTFQKMVKVLEG